MTALTTAQAAAAAGISPEHFRSAMSRERKRGRDARRPREEWPDGRTPLWDRGAVEAWAERRKGERA